MMVPHRPLTTMMVLATLALTPAGCSTGSKPHHSSAGASAESPKSPATAATPTKNRAPTAANPGAAEAQFTDTTTPGAPSDPALADKDSGAGSATTPTRFNGAVSLWGDVPADGAEAPTDASGNLRQVSFTREGADFDLDIDPTGRWLVYASTRHRTTADIYLKSVDGNTITQVTSDGGNDVMPTFSPDGKAIAFASDRSGSWDIYIQNIDGGQPIQITNSPAADLHPSWSPDGATIVFSSRGLKSEGQWEIVVVDVANPAKQRFIGLGLFPKFSPQGDKIVFQRARYRGTRTFSVWTLDYVNGEGLRPTEIAAATNAAVINPTWSPDGKRLAFATVVHTGQPTDKPAQSDLWAINLDGTGRVKLTNDQYANLQPVWAADGTIYFVSDRSGWENVWSLRPTKNVQVAGAKDNSPTRTAEVPTAP